MSSFSAKEFPVLDHDVPLAQRMRNIFELRTANTGEARQVIALALLDKQNSTLLRHEAAFVLGQMQHNDINAELLSVLTNTTEDPIVRHEAAEALAAIGDMSALPILQHFSQDKQVEVAETCKVAVEKLLRTTKEKDLVSLFQTVDPAHPLTSHSSAEDVTALEALLIDEAKPLYERYQAMFTLRNLAMSEVSAARSLSKGMLSDKSSALFRHEVAYVLGQLESADPVVINALKEVLENQSEHSMVRHEAAEALGAIQSETCIDLLKEYKHDSQQIVRESCVVALDVKDYWDNFSK